MDYSETDGNSVWLYVFFGKDGWKDGRNSKDVRNEFQVKQWVNFNCDNDLASLVPLFVDDLICLSTLEIDMFFF